MNFGLMYQPPTDADGPRVHWAWLWGVLTAVLTAIIVAGFRLVWRGAMADFELRLESLERELIRLREREARRIHVERPRYPHHEDTP